MPTTTTKSKSKKPGPKPKSSTSRAKKTPKSTHSQAKNTMHQFKMEAAREVGVNLKQGYNGDLTAKQTGSVGGQMVKKMIQSYEQNMR